MKCLFCICLYYYYQRWYDLSTGRFISRDPLSGGLSDPQSQNPYIYVSNTPTSLLDPSGMLQEGEGDCFGSEDCSEPRDPLTGNGIKTTGDEGAKPLQIEVNPTPTITDTTEIGTNLGSIETNTATPMTMQVDGVSPNGYKFVSTPNGHLIRVPENGEPRLASNGRGLVFQEPGAIRNANMIRIMDPTNDYPEGYVVYYHRYGQPLDVFGSPGGRDVTHIPLDYYGPIPGWP